MGALAGDILYVLHTRLNQLLYAKPDAQAALRNLATIEPVAGGQPFAVFR